MSDRISPFCQIKREHTVNSADYAFTNITNADTKKNRIICPDIRTQTTIFDRIMIRARISFRLYDIFREKEPPLLANRPYIISMHRFNPRNKTEISIGIVCGQISLVQFYHTNGRT